MRRNKSREINIFSMSALDLFASALGAFILIAIVALPYYLNNARITHHFFVITMNWESDNKQDIDLIIKDPEGRYYTFNQNSYLGSSGALTVDSKNVKSGTEIWIDKKIDAKNVNNKTWEVYYKRFPSKHNNERVTVSGSLFSSVGTFEFTIKNIGKDKMKERIHIATIRVTNNQLNVDNH